MGYTNGELDVIDSDPIKYSNEAVIRRRKAKPKMAETWPEMIREWPKTTFCIVSNEFCERFSYYGMRTVLTLYLLNVLKFSGKTSTIFFNGFTVLCYLSPILGSILADGYIGKFKTIFFVSLLYAFGQIVLAVASTQQPSSSLHPYLDLAGLVIIGFGTGGIKPCVASFGGDQFPPYQEKMLSLFFSVFYFSINAGAMISTFISPIFRATPCLNQDTCYPLAFGIPAALMVIATLCFLAGSFWYKKPPPKENIFAEVFNLGKKACTNKIKGKSKNRSHWLDYYFDTHSCAHDPSCRDLQLRKRDETLCHKKQFVDDVKSLLRLLVMYLPVPVFWALYDQQGSRWMIQSIQMDCRIWGGFLLLPDQMQTLNAILILIFIPLFQIIIYPFFGLFFTLTPLRKMIAGGVLAAIAFVVSAGIQLQINPTLPDLPPPGHGFVSGMNLFDKCSVDITYGNGSVAHLEPNQVFYNDKTHNVTQLIDVPAGDVTFNLKYSSPCDAAKDNLPTTVSYKVVDGETYFLSIGPLGTVFAVASTEKPQEGTGEFSAGITLAIEDWDYDGHLALCRNDTPGVTEQHPCDPRSTGYFFYFLSDINKDDPKSSPTLQNYQTGSGASLKHSTIYEYKPIQPGNWKLYYMENIPKKLGELTMSKEEVIVTPVGVNFDIQGQGGVYMILVNGQKATSKRHIFQPVPDNSISILWQVPQIAIITAAEILFSITGYEFAYSQAAPSMKSLVQALWLLTTAVGDTIIVLIALIDISNMAFEFLFYAGMMLVIIFIFALMSIFYYKYKFYTGSDENDTDSLWSDTESQKQARLRNSPDFKKTAYDNGAYSFDPNSSSDPYNWKDHF